MQGNVTFRPALWGGTYSPLAQREALPVFVSRQGTWATCFSEIEPSTCLLSCLDDGLLPYCIDIN